MGERMKKTGNWVKNEAKKPFEGVGTTTSKTQGKVKSLLRKLKHEDARVETFQQAVERLNLSGSDIRKRYEQLRFEFVMYATVFVFITLFTIDFIIAGSFFPALICLSILMLVLSLLTKASFTAFRIRRRSMGGLGLWVRSPGEWWPASLPPETAELTRYDE